MRAEPGFVVGGAAGLMLIGVLLGSCTSGSAGGDSCPEALDAAEVVIDKASGALGAVGDAINSFVANDGAGIAAANEELDELTRTVEDDMNDFERLAAECRAG